MRCELGLGSLAERRTPESRLETSVEGPRCYNRPVFYPTERFWGLSWRQIDGTVQGMTTSLSQLRQHLRRKLAELDRLLEPAFDREPVFPGGIAVSRHRCGKPNCRCVDGELHEAVRLAIYFKDGAAYRCLNEDGVELWRPRTEAYRRIRQARRSFGRWQKEVVELLDSIERARRRTDGLSAADSRRPLR